MDDAPRANRRELAPLLALAVAPGALAALAPSLPPAALVALYGALFIPYAIFLWRLPHSTMTPGRLALAIGLAALAARLPLTFATPLLSDDLYRYVWDGRVAHAGVNPFLHAPASDALAHLRDAQIWPLINHPEVPTIYPPAAQALFHLNAWLGGGLTLLRLLLVACEAAALGATGWLLATSERAPWAPRALVLALAAYALNPLVFIETAWSGHVDALAFGALAAALATWTARPSPRGALAAAATLGLSASAKFLGLLVLPLLFFAPAPPHLARAQAHARRAIVALVTPLVLAGSYGPYADAGEDLFAGFGTFAARWRSNDGGFRVLEATVHAALEHNADADHRVDPDDPRSKVYLQLAGLNSTFTALGITREWEGRQIPDTGFAIDQASQTTAKAIGALLMAFALLWCLLVIRDPIPSALLLFGALFFVAPTVHPWYVAWLVPLGALMPRGPSRAALTFSALSVLAYSAWVSSAAGGEWAVPWWLAAIEYGVVAVVAFREGGVGGDT
jgi:hypothetical protein